MTFSSLWPLIFIAAIPVIIILYLLKPKGKDEEIPSNILWERLFRNTQSKTFFEKFVHNILMYIQIVIMLLLIFALMAPFIKTNGKKGQNVILLLDASGSMQHKGKDNVERFDVAVDRAISIVEENEGASFTIIKVTDKSSMLLSNCSDRSLIKKTLNSMECTDLTVDVEDAISVVKNIYESKEEEKKPRVVVLTDDEGLAGEFGEKFDADVYSCGETAQNISIDYLSIAKKDGKRSAVISVTNYGESKASFDAAIYDSEGNITSMSTNSVEAGKSSLVIFDEVPDSINYYKAELSDIEFEGGEADSLDKDNETYYINSEEEKISAALVSSGNTFIEKAFTAITGEKVTRVENDSNLSKDEYSFVIYDSSYNPVYNNLNRLVFHGKEGKKEELKNCVVSFTEGKLTNGIGTFSIGVNSVISYDLPDWAIGCIKANDSIVGYYGEHDGIKEIVLGFDIRESDFALSAEYPMFMANCINYLGGSGILAENYLKAGENVLLNPTADKLTFSADNTDNSGICSVERGEDKEYYYVKFHIDEESDGKKMCAGYKSAGDNSLISVKKSIRNLLLIIALILLLLEGFIFVRQMNYRGKFYYAVRAVLVLAIALAISGVGISKKSNAVTTIFVVDVSESNSDNIDEMSEYIRKAVSEKPKDNKFGIVTFGKNQAVEQFVTVEKSFVQFMSYPDNTATNIQSAMERALSMIDSSEAGRIVIMTDGKETKGDINNINSAMLNSNVEMTAVKYKSEIGKDAFISNAELPGYLHKGDKYKLSVSVESNYETEAVLYLRAGSKVAAEKKVHLIKGSNQFVFDLVVMDDTMESYTLEVAAEGDTLDKNNSYAVYSMVESTPRVLVISGSRENSKNFESMLKAMDADFTVLGAKNAPSTLNEMLRYKTIILENTFRKDLPEGFLENIDSYVKDYGCGLIMTGGEDSFAMGGYRDTEIEDILPVYMDIKSENEIPSMAMIMVIDHSGSMISPAGDGTNATNLDVAIQAACDAVDNLRETDYVGVLTFDDRYSWQVEPVQAYDKEAIKKEIQTINDGGGTTIKPALAEAYNKIVGIDVQIKHLILLTDGMGETDNFTDVTDKISNAGVTLSTVAVGDESDTRLLEKLANDCKGRYYFADISEDIPKIFAQEVFLSSESYIQNGNFSLCVNNRNDITKNLFEAGWPNILAYIKATPKQTTSILIESEEGDPILSTIRYGLGYAVAWNTDVSGAWTVSYSGNEDYVQLWKRIIDFSEGGDGAFEDEAVVERVSGKTMIRYTAVNYTEDTEIKAFYTKPNGEKEEITLKCTAPSLYEAELPSEDIGLYNINLRREDASGVTNSINTAAVVQFSEEYRFDISSDSFDNYIAKNGKLLTDTSEVWKKTDTAGRKDYSLRTFFIILAIILFILDIAFRRFGYEPNFAMLKKIFGKKRIKPAEAEAINNKEKNIDKEEAEDNGMKDIEKDIQKDSKKSSEKSSKKDSKKGGKKDAKPEPKGLDTSALLKKKDDRNI